MRQRHVYRQEHALHLPPEKIGNRARGALVRPVKEIRTGLQLEEFHRDMVRRTDAGRRKIELAWAVLRGADEILQAFYFRRRMHDEQQAPPCRERDRREIANRIVLRIAENAL